MVELRTKLEYNNYMYALAGYIAERLKPGIKWEQLIKMHILEPLEMTATTTNDDVSDWTHVATPYILHEDTLYSVHKELIKYVLFFIFIARICVKVMFSSCLPVILSPFFFAQGRVQGGLFHSLFMHNCLYLCTEWKLKFR